MQKYSARRKISIRLALSSLGVMLILFTSLAIGVATYLNTRSAVESLSQEVFNGIFEQVTLTAGTKLDGVDTILRLNRSLVGDGIVDPDDLEALGSQFVQVLRSHEFLSETGYGDREGRAIWAERDAGGAISLFHIEQLASGRARERRYSVGEAGEWVLESDSEESAYDPRSRPWYRDAAASENPVWTDPYVFWTGIPGLSRSWRLLDESGEVIGVFDASFELDFLSEFLREAHRDQAADLFVVSRESGQIIAHPDPGATVNRSGESNEIMTVARSTDRRLREAYAMLRGELEASPDVAEVRARIDLDGEKWIVLGAPFETGSSLGWYALSLTSEERVLGPVHRNNRITLGICLAAIVIGVVVAVVFSRRMSHRLNLLAGELEDVGQLILKKHEEANSVILEIDVLDKSVNHMKAGLSSFSKFVPEDLVRSLLARGVEAKLGGHSDRITILFSDVIGFTSISEVLTPEELVDQLGSYLEEMTTVIETHSGTVNQYVGDSIMALWGAPEPVELHALEACRGALAFARREEELAEEARRENRPVFLSRIGINTGDVVVGNLGSTSRLYYSANGDTVNLASRLESINNVYGTRIVVSEFTKREAGSSLVYRALDQVAVKGKSEGVRIHELVGARGEVDDETLRFVDLYEEGLEFYRERRWDDAIGRFEDCLAQREDVASSLLKERCEVYRENPPTDDWSGVFGMRTK